MNALRLVLIARRYWPLVGSDAAFTADFAANLRTAGDEPLVLTALWHGSWPAHVSHQETKVARLPYSTRGRWSAYRYSRALSTWLKRNQNRYDAVYVIGLREEAEAAMLALHGASRPVVCRPIAAGLGGDCHWQLEHPSGARIKAACCRAAAFVAGDAAQEAELIAAGYPRDRIHHIPLGVPEFPAASMWNRDQCRAALVDCSRAFYLPQRAPLAIYVGDLLPELGLETLLEAWPRVLVKHPLACLWLIGDGPQRVPLHQLCERLRLHQRVLMPGAFDQVTDLLASADLFVSPQAAAGVSESLLRAMAVGLPVVAAQPPGGSKNPLVVDRQTGRLAAGDDANSIADAILAVLDDPISAGRMGAAARQKVQTEYSLTRSTELHQQLFRRLCDPNFQLRPQLLSP